MEQIKQNINLTGNRVLFILSLLLERPLSKRELVKLIENNPELKNVSLDTIKLDVNTLKEAGFVIKNSKYDYKYHLIWTPIKIKFQKSEINLLNKIKKSALNLWDWKSIFNLYKTFKRITNYIEDNEAKEKLLDFRNFNFVDLKLLIELDNHCKNKDEILIEYNSPKGEIINIHLKCLEIGINHNTQKLYLYCKLPGYEDTSYLRLDKITGILNVVKEKTIEDPVVKVFSYKVKKSAFKNFSLEENEKVVSEDDNSITIETKIKNKFHFIQRLATLGEDAICDEEEIKSQFLDNLLKTREVYK